MIVTKGKTADEWFKGSGLSAAEWTFMCFMEMSKTCNSAVGLESLEKYNAIKKKMELHQLCKSKGIK